MNKVIATLDGTPIVAPQPTCNVKADRSGIKRWVTDEVVDSVLAVLGVIATGDAPVASRKIFDVWLKLNPEGDSRMNTSTITGILKAQPKTKVRRFIEDDMSSNRNELRWALR